MSQISVVESKLCKLLSAFREAIDAFVEEFPKTEDVQFSVSVPVDDIDQLHDTYGDMRHQPEKLKGLQRKDVLWLWERRKDYNGLYVGVLGCEDRAVGPTKRIVEDLLRDRLGRTLMPCAVVIPVRTGDDETQAELVGLLEHLDLGHLMES